MKQWPFGDANILNIYSGVTRAQLWSLGAKATFSTRWGSANKNSSRSSFMDQSQGHGVAEDCWPFWICTQSKGLRYKTFVKKMLYLIFTIFLLSVIVICFCIIHFLFPRTNVYLCFGRGTRSIDGVWGTLHFGTSGIPPLHSLRQDTAQATPQHTLQGAGGQNCGTGEEGAWGSFWVHSTHYISQSQGLLYNFILNLPFWTDCIDIIDYPPLS